MKSGLPEVASSTSPASPTPHLLPTELLHEIVLYRLANAFWDLLVEPDLDKDWDPLTPLLHASLQFRHVTTNLLSYIIGEPSLDDNPRTTVQYQTVLDEIKRLRILVATADPNETLDPDASIYHQIIRHEDCNSPILWHVRGIAALSLHLRMLDAAHKSSGLSGTFRGFVGSMIQLILRETKMPASICDAVFMPLHVRYFAMDTLAQRIMLLSKACGAICELLPDFLCVSEEQFMVVEPEFDKFLKPLSRPRDFREYLPNAESLPIPPPTLEALQFREALACLVPPADAEEGSAKVRVCRLAREGLLFTLPRQQRAAFDAVPVISEMADGAGRGSEDQTVERAADGQGSGDGDERRRSAASYGLTDTAE